MTAKYNPTHSAAVSSHKEWMFVWGKISRVGGTEQRMADAIEPLEEHNVHVTALIRNTANQNNFQKLMHNHLVRVAYAPEWLTLYKELLKFEGSVVWAFGLKQSLLARFVKRNHKVPWKLIMPRNGLDYSWKPWMHQLDLWTQKQVDLYISNSYAVERHLTDRGIHPRRVAVVTSALPYKWYEEDTQEANTRFIMVGNNRPEKNQLKGIEAFLNSEVPSTLTVYTDDGTSIKHFLQQKGREAQNQVSVIEGQRLEPQHFDAYGILLHPSIRESLPLTILEAQARGCFVLATNTGDTAKLITDDNGLLFDASSITDMTSKIVSAYSKLSRITKRPRAKIRTTTQYVKELVTVVDQVIDARAGASQRGAAKDR